MEFLKRNDSIKEYVNRTLIEKVGNNRTVQKILDVLAEKYSKTKGEQMLDLMRMISEFRMDDKVEIWMDRFEEMIAEVDRTDLATNLKYALTLQFMDRL